jgi:hypothetical protein
MSDDELELVGVDGVITMGDDWQVECVIPKNVPQVSEVAEMVKVAFAAAPKSMYRTKLYAALYDLLCCMSMDDMSVGEQTMHSQNLWVKVAGKFDLAFNNLHLKQKARDLLFSHFPNEGWPDGFSAYVTERKATKVSPTFTKTNVFAAALTVEDLQVVYFGSLVAARYVESRSYIAMQLLPHWIDPEDLDSGESMSGLLLAIRRVVWRKYCMENSQEAVSAEERKKPKEQRLSIMPPGLGQKTAKQLAVVAHAAKKIE